MLISIVLPRCSEPVKFAVVYLLAELLHFGRDLELLVRYGMGCVALGVILFLLRFCMLSYESNVNA